ncbi:hypothetical protein GRX03_15660 [Halovenus sp. WSH3]|uniref:Uncharacterized protein n=1 Tax=Halovenus carboxidivorans TaxID=2692199 RepID=A0A6B0T4P8_9EURY|nr:hypothetical protein [Halovenus carboxidivorans]MXR53034.1 hypothetical protein [Halovenus carboxidivorans]
MVERSGQFRVYRVVESVPHINLQGVGDPTLYTVYESGYGGLQSTVDELDTGDLVEATLAGDPEADDEPWRLVDVERVGGVTMDFAVDVDPPEVAVDLWEPELSTPRCAVLTEDSNRVGACCVQPREPLPSGAFVPNVLAGLLPLEDQLSSIPGVEKPAAEALFLDPDPPESGTYSHPYGVVLLFTHEAGELPDRFREAYDCPLMRDTRPDFDPYNL